jgi:hypothetical protein
VSDDRELLIAAMVRQVAHHHHCSLATVRCQIRGRSAEARAEYHDAGAPYGDDDRGFCRLPPRAPTPVRRSPAMLASTTATRPDL